jgi:site-specific DNA-methyltransferase (adenine-specific)
MLEFGRVLLATPKHWWDKLDAEFNFTLDAAADREHHMTPTYITVEENALVQDWLGSVWCSPPWKEPGLNGWLRHGWANAATHGGPVVMLLPVRTTMSWWHSHVMGAKEIRFINGQLEFVPYEPVLGLHVEPHCLVIFEKGEYGPPICSSYPAR